MTITTVTETYCLAINKQQLHKMPTMKSVGELTILTVTANTSACYKHQHKPAQIYIQNLSTMHITQLQIIPMHNNSFTENSAIEAAINFHNSIKH